MARLDEPGRIARLPHDEHGRPVPWFVALIDGKPDFRVIKPGALVDAVKLKLCWVCGGKATRHMAFVVGPMCTVNRTSAEPPTHIDCAEYSAHACPFLTVPAMTRRETHKPNGVMEPAGEMIARNPGVVALWVTKSWKLFDDGRGGVLFNIGDPSEVRWYREGREATRDEVTESVRTGLPSLEGMARRDPQPAAALADLAQMVQRATHYFPT